LVVIAIVGVLMALILPAVQASREASRRAECQNHLHEVGVAIQNYIGAKSKFPAGKKYSGARHLPATQSLAWSSFLLDYLEQAALFTKIDFTIRLDDAKNLPATGQIIPSYLCPSTGRREEHRGEDDRLVPLDGKPGGGMACIDYLGCSGPDKDARPAPDADVYGRQRGVLIGVKGFPQEQTMVEPPPIRPEQVTDGLSTTIAVAECTGRGVEVSGKGNIKTRNGTWASGSNVSHIIRGVNQTPVPEAWYIEAIISDHPSGANVLMCDAGVRFFPDDIDYKVLMYLCSRDGDEIVENIP